MENMKGRLTVHVYSDRYRAVQLMLGADWTDVLSTSRRHQATNRTQDQHRIILDFSPFTDTLP